MERLTWYIAAILAGVLLVLAGILEAGTPKDKTLDPDTCQEAGTCWIPAGGDPQPIFSKVEKGTFNNGYVAGRDFLMPGTKKGDNHLLWLTVIEEWYGPWCLKHRGLRSYYKCLQAIVFESHGNPYGYTKSSVWIERGLTSVHPSFAEEYDFAVCGDPEVAIWAASRENLDRREWIETGDLWTWLEGHDRQEKEWWLGAGGSLNAAVVVRMAKKANAHKVTPEIAAEKGVTPSKRLIGALRKWDQSGIIYMMKSGISITPWRMGFRMGRKKAQDERYPMISWRPEEGQGYDDVLEAASAAEWNHETMCYGGPEFYDPDFELPMPTPKAPFPGHKLFGRQCKKHKDEWRKRLGKTLAQARTLMRGTPEYIELQEQGIFPSDEDWTWWEEHIGSCAVIDSPVVQRLLDD